MTSTKRLRARRLCVCVLGALGGLASLPASGNSAGDPHIRRFVTTIVSLFDHAQSVVRTRTAVR
jgi:hypothetical protein